jgi:hypothetical protein
MISRCARTFRRAALPAGHRALLGALGLLALAACSASVDALPDSRAQRADPARSASDGEVLGANGQSPQDTLEGSPTNEHAAPGSPEDPATEAHERLDAEECIETDGRIPDTATPAEATDAPPTGAPATPGAEHTKRRVCPKLKSERTGD